MRVLRKFKKGVTLIELIVAIAVSTVIFVGVSGLLIFLNNTNHGLTQDAKTIYNANTLMHALEIVLDQSNNSLGDLPEVSKVFEDDYVANVDKVDDDTPVLFSVHNGTQTLNYHFYMQHFGYSTVGDAEHKFNNVFTSESKVKLEFGPVATAADMYSFIFNYGDEYKSHVSMIKNLYEGGLL